VGPSEDERVWGPSGDPLELPSSPSMSPVTPSRRAEVLPSSVPSSVLSPQMSLVTVQSGVQSPAPPPPPSPPQPPPPSPPPPSSTGYSPLTKELEQARQEKTGGGSAKSPTGSATTAALPAHSNNRAAALDAGKPTAAMKAKNQDVEAKKQDLKAELVEAEAFLEELPKARQPKGLPSHRLYHGTWEADTGVLAATGMPMAPKSPVPDFDKPIKKARLE
jgi:hypothetical protein